MGEVISYLAHLGIVRVFSVPTLMSLAIYGIWRLSAPPPWEEDGQ
jgi:hypothetical protein